MIKNSCKLVAAGLTAGFGVVFLSGQKVAIRLIAVFLMIALLTPVFLFGPTRRTQAQPLTNAPIQIPTPISAPPEAFIISNNNSLSSTISTAFGSLLSFSGKTISRFFDKSKTSSISAGLEQSEKQLTLVDNLVSETTNSALLPPPPAGSVRFDFDGDSKADIARWHASNTEWKIRKSSNASFQTETIGTGSSIIAPGDFDGDGKTDVAVFNAGTWTIKKSSNAQTVTVNFGMTGDKPVVGDYDGDGKSDVSIFRPSTSQWWILYSSNGGNGSTTFGQTGDITAQGNFDGDSKTDIAIFRPSTGDWHVFGSTAGYYYFHWGASSDVPVPGDYDGDGKTDFAVFRGATGIWYVSKSSTNNSQYFTQGWGNYGDQPVPADYDGDGKDDFSVWRPTTGTWHTIKSNGTGYDTQTLGVSGDKAVSSAYLKQIGGLVYSYDFAKTRLSPKNSTGGTDLYSRNFSWGTSLVELVGRAGLDAGFGISYNSLVWTKDPASNTMVFDADGSNVTPGFRFGFPTIEPVYFDSTTGKFAYLMVAPSGSRVEFRQTAASDTYETADSSYTQLKINDSAGPNNPAESLTLTVTNTSGTNMLYEWKGGAYRCKKITDRNGNYIEIIHDNYGYLQTVTDTLGRDININHNSDGTPSSITQTWKDTNGSGSNSTHTWATFTYTTQAITTNFSGSPTVIGPGDGFALKVLQKITFPTESNGAGPNTVFTYNTWGQVTKITNYAADNHELNHVRLNLPASATNAEPDCPRFSETYTAAENFNGGNEVTVKNSFAENVSYTLPDSSTQTGTRIEIKNPDGNGNADKLVTKIYSASSGWAEGLPVVTEDWADEGSGLVKKRWTWSHWTQDNENLSYIQNPRMKETKIGDNSNIKRTKIEYEMQSGSTTAANYGRVKKVEVFDAYGTNVLKQVETEYNNNSAYLSRRMISLPLSVKVSGFDQSESQLKLVSFVTYAYDEGDFTSDSTLEQNITSVIKHDTNFSSNFVIGRGNLTSTTRCDATYPSNCTNGITSSVNYNIAGGVVAQTTPVTSAASRRVKISYADNFNDTTTTRNSFAYPTKVYDPADNFSEVKYRFDNGANIWATSPAPQNQTYGKVTTRNYDNFGRLQKESLWKVTQGTFQEYKYARYEYPSNGIQSKVYSTIVDTDGNGIGNTADEVLTESWSDGFGRVRKSRAENPNSSGLWRGRLVEYNILGQVKRSTPPTEISVPSPNNPDSWIPAGDDYRIDANNNPTFLWKYQKYDWKGRIVRIIDTDGIDSSTLNNSDQLFNYEGCGCAGGQVITIQSQAVPQDDQPSIIARRVQKIHQDILGRNYKKEEMSWDGLTPYKTTVLTFNGRDQVTQGREYAGAEGSSNFQDTANIYDGFGRLWKTHVPEQRDSNNDPAFTITTYNLDDSIQSVTDARGTSDNYTYNNLGLVTQVDYSVPQGSSIPVTPTTYFSYDSIGNRTQMIDASGTTTYQYNGLSQITSETKQFTGLSGSYTLGYDYQLSGQVKKLDILPNNKSVFYNYDKVGRVNSVTGQGFVTDTYAINNVASNIKYRAWNNVKSIDYGSSFNLNVSYDNNLKVSSFQIPTKMEINYQYNADGRVKSATNLLDATFDRSYKYDHVERLSTAKAGGAANGQTNISTPYDEQFGYDAFNNSTSRSTGHWSGSFSSQAVYTQNRRNGWQYDPNGNVTLFDGISNIYDAAEEKTKTIYDIYNSGTAQSANYYRTVSEKDLTYDGDGDVVLDFDQTTETQKIPSVGIRTELYSENKEYNLKSTVLGGAVIYKYSTFYTWRRAQNSSSSWLATTNIFLHGKLLGYQKLQSDGFQYFEWNHTDPMATVIAWTSTNGSNSWGGLKAILDPVGANVGTEDPYIDPNPPPPPPPFHGEFGSPEAVEMVEVDGVLTPIFESKGWESVVAQCPRTGCGAIHTENGLAYFTAFADGYEGYMPVGSYYVGGGKASWLPEKQRKQQRKPPSLKKSIGKKRPENPPVVDPRTEREDTFFSGILNPEQHPVYQIRGKWLGKRDPQTLLAFTVERFGPRFDECIANYLEAYIRSIKDKAKQTALRNRINSLPKFNLAGTIVDPNLTEEQILRRNGFNPSKVRTGGSVDQSRNATLIPSEDFNNENRWDEYTTSRPGSNHLAGVVIHEGANLAAFYYTGDWYAFGDPSNPDPDSGAQIQRCVFPLFSRTVDGWVVSDPRDKITIFNAPR